MWNSRRGSGCFTATPSEARPGHGFRLVKHLMTICQIDPNVGLWAPRPAARCGVEVHCRVRVIAEIRVCVAAALRAFGPVARVCGGACRMRRDRAGPSPGTPLGQGPRCRPARRAADGRRRAGAGAVKVALILPLSAPGNAGLVAQSMRNSAELALAEFTNPNIQLLIKDDAGNPHGRAPGGDAGDRRRRRDHHRLAVCAHGAGGRLGRARARHSGDRVLDRCQHRRARRLSAELPAGIGRGARARITPSPTASARSPASFPTMPMARWWRRRSAKTWRAAAAASSALERYSIEKGKQTDAVRSIAQAARGADAIFIPDGPDTAPNVVLALTNAGVTKRTQLLGTGLWEDQRVFQDAGMQGALVCGARSGRLCQFRAALSRKIRTGPGAHRDACPMTRPRWSRPWCARRAHSASRKKC